MSSSSSEYFDALNDLELSTTLGVIPPINPLTTSDSLKNNLEDPTNIIRIDVMDAMKVLDNSVSFPSNDPLDPVTAIYIMCWFNDNFDNVSDTIVRWAEDIKYAFQNCDDKNDTDPKTNHKYKLFLEYTSLLTRQYFNRTRESPYVDNLFFSCNNGIKETYFRFRTQYQQMYYNNLRYEQYSILFDDFTGWDTVVRFANNNILDPLKKLTTVNVTYGRFLSDLLTIISNCHEFVASFGVLSQFILTTYPIAPFYGQNFCEFDDKLKCIYDIITNFPSYQSQLHHYPDVQEDLVTNPSIALAGYYTDYKIDWFNLAQNNRSIASCLCGIIVNYILHLMDKFIPYYRFPLFGAAIPSIDTGAVSFAGAQLLQCLLFYFIGVDDFTIITYIGGFPIFTQTTAFEGLYHRFAKDRNGLTSADIDYVFGSSDDSGFSITGILTYVVSKLGDFLSQNNSTLITEMLIRSDLDFSNTPTYLFFLYDGIPPNKFFLGSFSNIEWVDQLMTDSTINLPPRYPVSFILDKKTQNSYINNTTIETILKNLASENTLECCFKTYVSTHLNILEGLNIPTSVSYFTPSISIDIFGTIISYNSLTITDIYEKIPAAGPCPYSVINYKFLIETVTANNNNYINTNLRNIKYYIIAIINYILYSISRQILFSNTLPPLNINDITLPVNTLLAGNYIYGSGNSNTIQLLYNTYIWNQLIFDSFFGTGEYFDPIDLPDAPVCTSLTTTALLNNMFYLEWKFNRCFLNYLSTNILTNLYDLLAVNATPLPPPPPIPFIPFDRIANLERVSFVNTEQNKITLKIT